MSNDGEYFSTDFDRIQKLSMININAREELLKANEQLLNFQMNRYIKHMQGKQNKSMPKSDSQRNV